jgi:hypothetical protein
MFKVGVPVEVAVGDGFHDVVGEDVGAAFEVGDGAGDFEDAVVGASLFLCYIKCSSSTLLNKSRMSE